LFQAGLPVCRSGIGPEALAAQAQAIGQGLRIGAQHPGAQARQPRLPGQALGLAQLQPELVAARAARIAHPELGIAIAGLGGLLPEDLARRIAAAVAAHLVQILPGQGGELHGPLRIRRAAAGRQRRAGLLGRRIDPDLAGRPPHAPGAEQAEGKARLDAQRGQRVQAAPRHGQAQLQLAVALGRHVDPGTLLGALLGGAQADAVARRGRVVQADLQAGLLTGEHRRGGAQVKA